jgi:hypothetical protein
MATPPTCEAEYETAWSTVAAGAKTASVTVGVGDVLVICGITESNTYTLATPTGGGLTYTLAQSIVTADYTACYAWTAVSASSQTFTLSVTMSGGTGYWGFNALRFSATDGVGASTKTNVLSGAPSLALTTGTDNAAIVVANGDWNAADGASRTWRTINSITPTSGNGLEHTYARDASRATFYVARWNDAGTAGSKTTGLSAPAGPKYSLIAVEGTAGGGATVTGTATGPFAFGTTTSGLRTVLGAATRASTFGAPAAGTRTVNGTAARTTAFTGTAAGQRSTAGTAASSNTFTASAAGERSTAGSGALAAVFTAAATGRPVRLGAIATGVTFGTSTTGQKTVFGAATSAATFTASAAGAGAAETVTGAATAPVTFGTTAAGQRTVNGTAAAAATFAAAAAGRRTVRAALTLTVTFAAAASGQRTVPAAATAPFVFAASVAVTPGIVIRPDTGTTARPATGTITRPFTGVISRP